METAVNIFTCGFESVACPNTNCLESFAPGADKEYDSQRNTIGISALLQKCFFPSNHAGFKLSIFFHILIAMYVCINVLFESCVTSLVKGLTCSV